MLSQWGRGGGVVQLTVRQRSSHASAGAFGLPASSSWSWAPSLLVLPTVGEKAMFSRAQRRCKSRQQQQRPRAPDVATWVSLEFKYAAGRIGAKSSLVATPIKGQRWDSVRAWHAPGDSFPGDLMSQALETIGSILAAWSVRHDLGDLGHRLRMSMSTCMAFLKGRELQTRIICRTQGCEEISCCSRVVCHFTTLQPLQIRHQS